MTNPVPVDGELEIERARKEFAEAQALADKCERSNASGGVPMATVESARQHADAEYARLRTAILKHDPVVAYLAEELALEDPANPAVLAWREAVSGDSR